MFNRQYEEQTRLLLRCLPELERHECFALKGGTAINLFARDLPRISVDIDLAYLYLKPRQDALADISEHLQALGSDISASVPGTQIREHRKEGRLIRVTIATPTAVIKIEPNFVFRGSVYSPEMQGLSPRAQERFEMYVRVRMLSNADLYGGKLCAALDRQHPRDLYDVKLLLEDEGITPDVRRAFVVYLSGHNRPMNELLNPIPKDISELFRSQFAGMTEEDVSLASLVDVQSELPRMLVSALDDDERAFLLALKRGDPEWDRLGIEHIEELPALQWKLLNIRRMEETKQQEALRRLEGILIS
jgi:predicted nucleotidyltransferase component of viral defense system